MSRYIDLYLLFKVQSLLWMFCRSSGRQALHLVMGIEQMLNLITSPIRLLLSGPAVYKGVVICLGTC